MASVTKKRGAYLFLLLLTIATGLLSRSSLIPPSSFIGTYAGDTLWAMAVFWSLAILSPCSPTWKLATVSLFIAFTVEASQLYRAPWIDDLRSIRLVALVLGSGFLWSDLLCYATGIVIAAANVEFWIHRTYITPSTSVFRASKLNNQPKP